MLVNGQRVGWSAAAWREVVVGGGDSWTLVHSGRGWSAREVIGVGWSAMALRDAAVMMGGG